MKVSFVIPPLIWQARILVRVLMGVHNRQIHIQTPQKAQKIRPISRKIPKTKAQVKQIKAKAQIKLIKTKA